MLHKFLLTLFLFSISYGSIADPAAVQCPPYKPLIPSEVKYATITEEDWPILQRMGKFFMYDLSEHMGHHKDWKFPNDGSYECETHSACKNLDRYKPYIDKNRFASFIYYKDEMAGFILGHINRSGKNTAEIFIISKFRNQGLGKHIADSIFKKYPGEWDAQSIGENHASKAIWGEINMEAHPKALDKSQVKLVLLKPEDLPRAQRMARFFLYDMLEYMGSNPRWYFPESGHYECESLKEFFVNIGKTAFPYFVTYKGELAGFVLINTKHVYPSTQYNLSEFFILRKFRGQGLGRYVAEQVFNKHPGVWEVQQMTENCAAIKFWEKVIGKYTKNRYTRALKPIPFLKNRIQVLEQFDSRLK